MMRIYPAIDLFGGRAVRLRRGDYAEMTVFEGEPPEIAKSFCENGAEFLHVVDLEGAKSGGTENFETVKKIIEKSGLKTQVGGGIRKEAVIEKYLSAGAHRVILGTAAAEDPGFLEKAVKQYGERVVIGVDIKDGFVATRGWTKTTNETAENFCARLEALGVRTVVVTDISKDGLLGGANNRLYQQLCASFSIGIIASGGVTTTDDIQSLAKLGLSGAILGRALYDRIITLPEALAAASARASP